MAITQKQTTHHLSKSEEVNNQEMKGNRAFKIFLFPKNIKKADRFCMVVNSIFHYVWEKVFKFMVFTFSENALKLGIFTHFYPTQNFRENFLKICFSQQQKGVGKTMISIIKIQSKNMKVTFNILYDL